MELPHVKVVISQGQIV